MHARDQKLRKPLLTCDSTYTSMNDPILWKCSWQGPDEYNMGPAGCIPHTAMLSSVRIQVDANMPHMRCQQGQHIRKNNGLQLRHALQVVAKSLIC